MHAVVNANPEHAYSVLAAHGDTRTRAAPYVGTAAGTEPWGQHVYPVGNLTIPEEKGFYS